MGKFIKHIILFSTLPFFAVAVFDIWLRNLNTSYSEKYDGLIVDKDSVEVLILGNSHANYGVDPKAFSKYNAYNLANVNQKLYFDKRLTLKAVDSGVSNLKYVFISVDYHSLHTSRQGIREVWSYYGNGVKHEDRNYLLPTVSPFVWGYTPRVSLALLKKKIKNRLKHGNPKIVDFDVEEGVNITDTMSHGFIGYTGQNKNRLTPEWYKPRVAVFEEPEESIRKEVIADLHDFIIQLKERNIEPILFSSPTFSEYNQYLDTVIINRNKRDIAKISYTGNVEFWDYMDSEKFSLEDFYDSDHLNKVGAKKFTKMLSNRLETHESTSTLNSARANY